MPTRFDYSDPRFMVVYANDEHDHSHAEEYSLMFKAWVERMNSAENRFGILFVNHEHDEKGEHARNETEENALTAIIVQFRREYRAQVNATTTGYASVYNGYGDNAAAFEAADQRTAQFANYMFGIRGKLFRTQPEALAWLGTIAESAPLSLKKLPSGTTTSNVAIFYGSTTGTTEIIAEKMQAAWAEAQNESPPLVNVGNSAELMQLLSYDKLLVGVPTWNIGKLQDDWEIVFPHLDQIDLSGKQIAIFGVGDQYGYPENFQDAMGILGRKLQDRGAQLVGYTSTAGYEHAHSIGVDGDQFMGLAIDDLNQPELTEARLLDWVKQVAVEFSGEMQTA